MTGRTTVAAKGSTSKAAKGQRAGTSSGGSASSSAQDRFDRRIRARRRRSWWLAGSVVLLGAVLAAGWWALWRSDWFLVEDVVVTGVEERWKDPVLQAAAVPMSQPLVEVDTDRAASDVRSVGIVGDVRIVRSWPTTITVEVAAREAVLAAQRPDGGIAVVDADGVTIEVVETAPAALPVVRSVGETGASPEAYRAAWGVMSALPGELLEQVTVATVSSADLVTLELGERTVVWGGPEEAELKASVVEALLDSDAGYVDVSAPRSPVTRPS